MERKLRTELFKMSGIMLVLMGLGIYAQDFVIAGIKAKMALNLSIFAIFALAASIAFKHVLALRNEIVALHALQIDYGVRSRRPKDPFAKPAIVFHEPELLGEGYHLIAGELGKQEDLQISTATVQTLLHDVDQRINDRKSTIIYFSGLMVFLGLLGAFMGLMKTVHSVSELIGAMDVSGKGGSDSFGKMIEGMKAPLNGMSVGFSSSLFGLMTSMVLGALERCMTSAMKSLRNEFERWLTSVAALEGGQHEAAQASASEVPGVRRAIDAGVRELAEMRGVLDQAAHQALESRADLDLLAASVAGLADAVSRSADPRPLLEPIGQAVADLARNQVVILAQLQSLSLDAEADRANLRATLGTLGALVERTAQVDGATLHRQLDQLVDLQQRAGAEVRGVARQNDTSKSDGGGLIARILSPGLSLVSRLVGLRHHYSARQTARELRRLRSETRHALATGREESRRLHRDLIARMASMEAEAMAGRDGVASLFGHLRDQGGHQVTQPGQEGPGEGGRPLDARAQLSRLVQELNARMDERAQDRGRPSAAGAVQANAGGSVR
ncbi:hypothetical protein [Novosphingobium cyanobacteriorum]|uniref:MotA/TolQ/ExbB proton channel domain-containing protein n=1 Tax=Novosphingobium cyanobacteriorum TaxID=3024215 RepID=A0ABT6CMM3_9SPHN|nr:hypothetical protein [Novosphingobium cyanobacteriorum]MDF8335169.1 hypothetical protein [Novosphingobium cyanobacteriorum]